MALYFCDWEGEAAKSFVCVNKCWVTHMDRLKRASSLVLIPKICDGLMWLGSIYNGGEINKLLPYLRITQMREVVHMIMNGKGIAESCSDVVCTMKTWRCALKKRKPILDHLVWR